MALGLGNKKAPGRELYEYLNVEMLQTHIITGSGIGLVVIIRVDVVQVQHDMAILREIRSCANKKGQALQLVP
jgi:hypothetical protein